MRSTSEVENNKHRHYDKPSRNPRNIISESFQLLFWLLFRPSLFNNHLDHIAGGITSDFHWSDLSREQIKLPDTRRLFYQMNVVFAISGTLLVVIAYKLANIPSQQIFTSGLFLISFSVCLAIFSGQEFTAVASSVLGAIICISSYIIHKGNGNFIYLLAGGILIGISGSVMNAKLVKKTRKTEVNGIIEDLLTTVRDRLWQWVMVIDGLFVAIFILSIITFFYFSPYGIDYVFSSHYYMNILLIGISNLFLGALSCIHLVCVLTLPYLLFKSRAGMYIGLACFSFIFTAALTRFSWLSLIYVEAGLLLGLFFHWWRPVLSYPLFILWNWLIYRLESRKSAKGYMYLRLNPAFWDEYQKILILGLSRHLVLVAKKNANNGWSAINYLKKTYQKKPALYAQIELNSIVMRKCTSVEEIALVYPKIFLDDLERIVVIQFRNFIRISKSIEIAIAQKDSYNRLIKLEETYENLDELLNGLFNGTHYRIERSDRGLKHIANKWHKIVEDEIGKLSKYIENKINENESFLRSCKDLKSVIYAQNKITKSEELPISALLRSFDRISQDTDTALRQEGAYNKRLALKPIEDRLDALSREIDSRSDRYTKRFLKVAETWRELVADMSRQLAQTAEQRQEIDSPYIIGVPLTAEQDIFVGRTDISARIERLLLDPRKPPLLLYGQRRMGKTSLLNNLVRVLSTTVVPLFVDLQGGPSQATDYAGFLYSVARQMISSAEKQRGLILPQISRESLKHDPFTQFYTWLDHVEDVLGQSTALLALDEFETLDSAISRSRFEEQDILGMLRHLIQHRPRFKLLLSASHTLEELQRWSSYFINMQVIHISYLTNEEACQLIEHPVRDFALRYRPEGVDRVLGLTRCHPFFIQLLCSEIIALKNEQDRIIRRLARLDDVNEAVDGALSRGRLVFLDIQNNQIDSSGRSLLKFISSHGEGAIVSYEKLVERHGNKIDATIDLLTRRELIELTDTGYRFQVELTRRWFAKNVK